MCQESKDTPTWPQLEHAIKRNFGGLETEKLNPFEVFRSVIPGYRELDLEHVPAQVYIIVYYDLNTIFECVFLMCSYTLLSILTALDLDSLKLV